MSHHIYCDLCGSLADTECTCPRLEDDMRRAARIEAAARELLARLPRCDRMRCSATGPAMFVDYTYQGPEYLCEKHAGKGKTPWADAAAKLAAELEE